MPIMYNTGDWFVLRPDTYRKLDLFTPDWPLDVDLEYMQLVGAPFGGPLAMMRDPKQIVPVKGSVKPMIRIFDTAGLELGKIMWNHGKLINMGWSDTEELICVQDDALVFIYDMFGNEKESYSMGQEASLTKIMDAKIFQSTSGTGVAVLTTTGRLFLKLNNAKDVRTRQLPEIPKSISECTCWEIVTEERNTYCLLGRDQEVIKLFPGESVGTVTRNLFDRPFERILLMSVSYNHQNLALYTNNGLLWLGTVDMNKKYCEFDTGRKDIPRQIEWVMNAEKNQADAVVISYPSFLLVVNCNGDKNLFTYDPAIFLVAEMDGVRIITNSAHEMIQKLPKCVQNIFAVNSQEPSSFLFEAQKKYQEKSHQADEYLSLFRDKMSIAVDECVEAAGYEFCTETQKSLLRTAYFGKGFIPSHNPDEYMRILRILRVLNTLRHEKIAMPLTYNQFCHLKPEVVLGRLVFRKHYAIAIQVAKHLKLPESWILEHWAYHKVVHDKNDNEVARKITEKFKNPSVQGISFCNIAEKAHDVGRDELAIKLLELEPRASLQVPLLLKLGKYDRAIRSATQSGDTELVATVLLEIKKKMMLANFNIIIREYPMALNIYKKMMNEWSRTALYDIYNQEDDQKSIAEYHFRNAIESDSLESNLPIIANSYTQGRKHVDAELCADTAKLLKLQKNVLTPKYGKVHQTTFNGLSIHDTLLLLLQIGELKEAEKIKSDFKVPDKRFWWLRIITMSEKYKWDDLEKFAKSKKSPIGYEPFVEVCLKQNNLLEARKYIMKCRDDRKAHWYLRAELLDEATDSAFEQRDMNILYAIQNKASTNGNRALLEKIGSHIAALASKK
ncbi:vacuolar protein sorting-associated protein 16 homolog isoform X2 [Anastrepha obliqua]|uniref:vacuolar protein sorting-associated protein 16 homolog isoform X2 n=1 Tax=Anastrepha obliqua TaxID=95512 RepID=UPI00240A027C|nr:vacuolar protein sorting-associated protein 16 homolog isoform X2 [Anastrepha obliqua]